jgi:hypothetical protein
MDGVPRSDRRPGRDRLRVVAVDPRDPREREPEPPGS